MKEKNKSLSTFTKKKVFSVWIVYMDSVIKSDHILQKMKRLENEIECRQLQASSLNSLIDY